MGHVVVFGGYGTFGARVARHLVRLGLEVIIAGRDAGRAAQFAAESKAAGSLAVDVTDPASCSAALGEAVVAVNCAGPFQGLGTTLLEACIERGCHYADLADDREYVRQVRGFHKPLLQAGLTAAYGCSSLPGISGALAERLMLQIDRRPAKARVVLFIGNNNPKGRAAIESAVGVMGRAISAPQGTIYGFRDREAVNFPVFGRRTVVNFESPEYDLFPSHFDIPAVTVTVGFESRIVTAVFALVAALGPKLAGRMAPVFTWLGRHAPRTGSSGGAVLVELFTPEGKVNRAAMVSKGAGQEMAALPCAYVVHALSTSAAVPRGAVTAYQALGASALLERLVQHGCELSITGGID